MKLKGRIIYSGNVEGEVLYTNKPLLFYGGINVETGMIIDKGHPLAGSVVKDKILVFPEAKGSTVGSYTLLQLKKNKMAPKAMINKFCEPIVATGAIMSRIPCVDKIPIEELSKIRKVKIQGNEVITLTE
ncbi:MAG: aconitase X swivel domain-containing protein [Candidatus Hodarchaeota archaeon]